MKRNVQLALAEKGLGFFSIDIKKKAFSWDEETARMLGDRADTEKMSMIKHLTSPLRSYLFQPGAAGERLRCLIPLNREVMETVILPPEKGADGVREGFFFPYSLNESLDLMKKYFLSNISNKLRSVLNSVIIASDVVAASKETIHQHQKFLSLMTEDAREVNTLLNRLGEIINYAPPGAMTSRELVETSNLLTTIYANMHYLAEDASIALNKAVPEAIPAVRGHFTLLILTFFLAVHYALSKTEPMGEILITARDHEGWQVEICFSNTDIPSNMAVNLGTYGLKPVAMGAWSESAALQLIDSLLGLHGTKLTLLSNNRGLGMLILPLPRP